MDEPHGALWVVAALEPTDVAELGHGPAHPLGAPPFLPFRTAPICIPVNTLGGEGTHGLQLLKATVAQHGGAKLGHHVDELQEGGGASESHPRPEAARMVAPRLKATTFSLRRLD